jgi:hypothetical protein
MAVSNNLMTCINFLILLCTVPIAATGVWLASHHGGNGCTRLARRPVAALGALLLVDALVGFLGTHGNRSGLLACYLFSMAGLITLLLALVILPFTANHGFGAYAVPEKAYDNYRLEGYSPWLRRYVAGDTERWEGIRACVAGSEICNELAMDSSFIVPEQFYMTHLSPIQVISQLLFAPTPTSSFLISLAIFTSRVLVVHHVGDSHKGPLNN